MLESGLSALTKTNLVLPQNKYGHLGTNVGTAVENFDEASKIISALTYDEIVDILYKYRNDTSPTGKDLL